MPLKEFAERRNLLHRKSDAQTILKHVLSDVQLGPVALVSSFGAEAVVLLHMVAQIDKTTPVVFLDTEMLFPETLAYQKDLSAQLGLTDVRVIGPDRTEVLTNFDIFAAAGANNGIVRTFDVISDGNLDIDFTQIVNSPAVQGIEVIPTPVASTLGSSPAEVTFGSTAASTRVWIPDQHSMSSCVVVGA